LDPDTMLSGSLQLRILRRFLQTVNVKENKKYYSKSLKEKIFANGIESIDENIFDALQTKPAEKCDYLPLIQVCHNLAYGIFISPSSTKELLFLFAFAYDMRYYSSKEQSDYDVTRDVEKNLFVDYYCDNLTRFLDSDTGALSGTSDNEPSGIVINPKNFVDIVFVYFLNRNDIMTENKVAGFFTSINKIKKLWKEREGYIQEIKNKYGDEFLELLMDVQESVANSLHLDYKRVSDETFDMGEIFFKDDRFWCSLEEMSTPKKEEVTVAPASQDQEETMDVSKGNFAGWTKDEFDKEMYSEEGDADAVSTDKVYLDDEVETESVDTAIDMSTLASYETDAEKEEDVEPHRQKNEPPKQNDSIMNSQRGHESTVLNSGGV